MKIKQETATKIGITSFILVFLMHALYSFSCNKVSFSDFISTALISFGPALLFPALFLVFKKGLIAAGGALLVLPWLMLAYYVDCIMPYQGGGASMIYVAVFFWSPPSAIVGMIIAGSLIGLKKIEID